MVKKKTKKEKGVVSKQVKKPKNVSSVIEDTPKQSLLSQLSLGESYTSLLLGLIVVVVMATLLVFLVKPKTSQDTSATHTDVMTEKKQEKTATLSATPTVMTQGEPSEEKITGTTYIVKEGDGGLWYIAVRAYGNGERWTEIAQANNLSSPDAITEGMTLKIPR